LIVDAKASATAKVAANVQKSMRLILTNGKAATQMQRLKKLKQKKMTFTPAVIVMVKMVNLIMVMAMCGTAIFARMAATAFSVLKKKYGEPESVTLAELLMLLVTSRTMAVKYNITTEHLSNNPNP